MPTASPATTPDGAARAGAAWIRFVTFTVIAWYLLSRDFPAYADAPSALLSLYPTFLEGWLQGHYALTPPPLIDLVSGHWLHWLLPRPDHRTLLVLQAAAAALCLLVAVTGRGRYGARAWPAIVLTLYLVGYTWRADVELDGIFLPLQIALLYAAMAPRDGLVARAGAAGSARPQTFFGATLAAFVLYYWFSGLNKLIDVSLAEWVGFELYSRTLILERLQGGDFPKHVPDWAARAIFTPLADYAVSLVYLSHLLIPIVLVDPRRLIPTFGLFYLAFHALSLSMGIVFLPVMALWLALIPVALLAPRRQIAGLPLLHLASVRAALDRRRGPRRWLRRALSDFTPTHRQRGALAALWGLLALAWAGIAVGSAAGGVSVAAGPEWPLAAAVWALGLHLAVAWPRSGAWFARGLAGIRPAAWIAALAPALAITHGLTLQAAHHLLWAGPLLSAWILWGVPGWRRVARTRPRALKIKRAFVAASLSVYAIPGLIVPPLSPGVEGWGLTHAQDTFVHTGPALVRDDGKTVWLSHRLTNPSYWPERPLTMGFPRTARTLASLGLIDHPDRWADRQGRAVLAWYARRYERAYPALIRGRYPYQRFLGSLAMPTHNPSPYRPGLYRDFPPDRLRGVALLTRAYRLHDGRTTGEWIRLSLPFVSGAQEAARIR